MKLITFNPLRTIGIPSVKYIKPDHLFKEIDHIKEADFLLFPEHWQVNTLVYGLNKQIFPSIQSIHLGYSKIEMTRALWSVCAENVPYTEILGSSKENVRKVLETFAFPFVAKESRNSMGKGVFLIQNEQQFLEYASKNDVLYIQEYLETDRDLRICVIGDHVVASYWRIAENGEFHHNVAKGAQISTEGIPAEAIELVKRVADDLKINHAGFDILVSNNKFYILEFNVLFGNQGMLQNGVRSEQLIYEYLLMKYTPTFPTTPVTPLSRKRIS
jgi:ribosomal protein S6--L-glutamate ligase